MISNLSFYFTFTSSTKWFLIYLQLLSFFSSLFVFVKQTPEKFYLNRTLPPCCVVISITIIY